MVDADKDLYEGAAEHVKEEQIEASGLRFWWIFDGFLCCFLEMFNGSLIILYYFKTLLVHGFVFEGYSTISLL